MRHRALRSALLLSVLATVSLSARWDTSVSGVISGIELCEQAVCGKAIFAALFAGQIDGRPAGGLAFGGINHTPLPVIVGDSAIIDGGQWSIRTLRRTLEGYVVAGGTITKINDTQFAIGMSMVITSGGTGDLNLTGILDHGPFPPTIRAAVTP